MNLNNLRQKLIAAARVVQPSDHVPYAFEKRIMARLMLPVHDAWAAWSRALWRAAVSCLVIMALSAAWTFISDDASDNSAVDNSNRDFAQEFESTLLVSAYSAADASW